MKDHNKRDTKPISEDLNTHCVDLTSDMELPAESGGRIIDLTDALDGPLIEPRDRTRALQSTEPQPIKTIQNEMPVEAISSIEKEIDAAFDAVEKERIPTSEGPKKAEGGHDVDNLTQLAGEALDAAIRWGNASEKDQPIEIGMSLDEEPEEEILELTDIAEQPQSAAEQRSQDDDVIELVDFVEPMKTEDHSQKDARIPAVSEDDDVIELTEVINPRTAAVQDPEAEENEDALELVDIVAPAVGTELIKETEPAVQDTAPAAALPISATAEKDEAETAAGLMAVPEEEEEGLIELTDLASTQTPDSEDNGEILRLSDVIGTARKHDRTAGWEPLPDRHEEKPFASLPAEETPSAPFIAVPEDDGVERPSQVNEEKIKALLEELLQTKYADDIERMIAMAVEKAVHREIEAIKRSLMDDGPLPE